MDLFEKFALTCLMAPLGDPNNPLTHWGVPFNAIGQSGAGKSARIAQISKALGLPCFTIFASTKQPEHFSGVPVSGPNGFSVECILPQVTQAIDNRKAVIFLDEFSTVAPAVQAALLSFINERQVGEYVLPPGVRIVIAMNPPDEAANGTELALPVVNRMAHVEYTPPTVDQWGEYMASLSPGYKKASDMMAFSDAEERIKRYWAQHYEVVHGMTHSFLKANAGTHMVSVKGLDGKATQQEMSKLQAQPQPDEPRAAGPWPSCRTWTLAVMAVTASRCLEMGATLEVDLISRIVGDGLATEWISYMTKQNLPSPEEALSGKWQIPRRMDIVRAVIRSAAQFVAHHDVSTMDAATNRAAWAVQCWTLLRQCMDGGYADIVVDPARVLIHAGLDIENPDTRVQQAAEDVCAELTDNGMIDYVLRRAAS